MQEVTFVAAAGAIASGVIQASYAFLTRRMSRRPILAVGGLLFGLGFAAEAAASAFMAFAVTNVPTGVRDVAFALYFTLAFGVGSLWTAVYGAIIEAVGEAAGLPIVFGLMAASFLAAAVIMFPVRDPPRTARAALAND